MSHNLTDVENILLTPEKRFQRLLLLCTKIELNTSIAARKYYRSGKEMTIMADICLKENKLDQAYILYMRFMILFLETIKQHPDYKNVPIEERNLNYRALRDVFPKIGKIKTKLLEKYSVEYKLYQEQKAFQEFKEKHEKEEDVVPPGVTNVIEDHLSNILDFVTVPPVPEVDDFLKNNHSLLESN